MCSALAVTKEHGNASLPTDTQVGLPPSPSSNYLAGLLTRKAQKRTMKRPHKALYCTSRLGGRSRMDVGDSRGGKAGLLSLPFGPATRAQSARFSQGLQAFQELGRVDQPRPALETAPSQLASHCFSGTWTQDTVKQGLFRSFYSNFLFKPKVVLIPSYPHCSFYLG